jgi:hypothetical protein
MKNKVLAWLLTLCFVVSGCAGRTPNPVSEAQPGDERKSCNALKAELSNVDADIERKAPGADKTGMNVILGIAGIFLLVPWFFMDLSKADQTEVDALKRRHNAIAILASERDCSFEVSAAPDAPKPPAAEEKRPFPK